jgi:hypothetical protein
VSRIITDENNLLVFRDVQKGCPHGTSADIRRMFAFKSPDFLGFCAGFLGFMPRFPQAKTSRYRSDAPDLAV